MTARLKITKTKSLNLPISGVKLNRILLVEDHPIVSSGLSALLNCEPDLRVCGIAHDYASALEGMDTLHPDLIIADLCLKGCDGLELLKDIKLRCPEQRLLVLSMHDESIYASRALRAGASGYVMKQAAMGVVLTAIHTVLEGNVYLSEPMEKLMIRRVSGRHSDQPVEPFETLTDRELEVFRLIGQARTTREIAAHLHRSVKTIESHRARLKRKLELPQGRDLLRYALSRQQDTLEIESKASHGAPTATDSWQGAVAGLA